MQTTKQMPLQAAQRAPLRWMDGALSGLRSHWPEYLIEGALLGAFMISACVFGVLLEHPNSPLHQQIENAIARRVLMGLAMGLTLVGIVYSPWGRRSGAHINPAVTLTFLALRKIDRSDATFYTASHFVGAGAGVEVAALLIGPPIGHGSVNYAVTIPGTAGAGVAFWAEALISVLMMTTILVVSNTKGLAKFTGLFAGALLALFITVEAPLSGVSLNPARTLGSAFAAGEWVAIWLYFTAPPLAMLLVGHAYQRRRGAQRVFCAKLYHHSGARCIFRCNHGAIDVHE